MRCEPQRHRSPYLATATADMDLSSWQVVNHRGPRNA